MLGSGNRSPSMSKAACTPNTRCSPRSRIARTRSTSAGPRRSARRGSRKQPFVEARQPVAHQRVLGLRQGAARLGKVSVEADRQPGGTERQAIGRGEGRSTETGGDLGEAGLAVGTGDEIGLLAGNGEAGTDRRTAIGGVLVEEIGIDKAMDRAGGLRGWGKPGLDPVGTGAMLGDIDRDLRRGKRPARHPRRHLLPGGAKCLVVLHGVDPNGVDAHPVGLALMLEADPPAAHERHLLVREGEGADRALGQAGREAAGFARNPGMALLDDRRPLLGVDDTGEGGDPERQHIAVRQTHHLGVTLDQPATAGQFDQVARRQ